MQNHLPFSLNELDLQHVNAFSTRLLGANKLRIALVVQGGGQRGIFTAGVFDAFLEAGFDPFELYIGTSAGALNLSSFISRQHQFGYNFIVNYTTENEFFNLYKYLSKQKPMNLDWALECVASGGSLPLDISTAKTVLQHRTALACATRKDNLQDIYLPMYQSDWRDVLRASCAIPVIYNQPVNLRDLEWVDGGVSAAVPVREAWLRGADLVVVVRTEPVTGLTDESSVFNDWREKIETALPDYIDRLSLNQSLDKVKSIRNDLTQRFEQWKLVRQEQKVKTEPLDDKADSIANTIEQSRGSNWRLLSADNIERFLSIAGKGKSAEILEMLNRYYKTYDEMSQFLLDPPEGLKVIQITPERPLKSRALLSDKDDLEVDYREGKLVGRHFVEHFSETLNEITALKQLRRRI
ncbi:Putative esterase of the alpha-beta hydrolase superfamily [Photobacterium marinum]|uniref:Putative esterase of the alpha-beta hydrolase superfamily n=1 Tax=Photobacterium marinum TaxID=1056511 RepID=L8JG31_9GAMM|nr:patatin family protein [Photobacterium marinum]ELR67765.1 Putative esterase of the alpha-beta hydrolase superfamily [Photobacterium marinum]